MFIVLGIYNFDSPHKLRNMCNCQRFVTNEIDNTIPYDIASKMEKRGEWIKMWKTELFLEYIKETPTSLLNESFVWPTPISLQRWSGSAFWQKRSHPCRDTGAMTITPKGELDQKGLLLTLELTEKSKLPFFFASQNR